MRSIHELDSSAEGDGVFPTASHLVSKPLISLADAAAHRAAFALRKAQLSETLIEIREDWRERYPCAFRPATELRERKRYVLCRERPIEILPCGHRSCDSKWTFRGFKLELAASAPDVAGGDRVPG